MDMTPQGYPLHCVTPEGENGIVIGWTEPEPSEAWPQQLAPVVVLDGKIATPRVITGKVAYFTPQS